MQLCCVSFHSFISTQFEYCNSILTILPNVRIHQLLFALNCTAQVVTNQPKTLTYLRNTLLAHHGGMDSIPELPTWLICNNFHCASKHQRALGSSNESVWLLMTGLCCMQRFRRPSHPHSEASSSLFLLHQTFLLERSPFLLHVLFQH